MARSWRLGVVDRRVTSHLRNLLPASSKRANYAETLREAASLVASLKQSVAV